ncbi:MAG: two-component regulator propeller domain-containing protein [Acidobacteriota bacterium]
MPQDSARAIAQTVDGALWVGTDEGLARFDGTEWTHFARATDGLPSSSVTALAASRDGSIWIGTPAGVSHFDGIRFTNFDRNAGLATTVVTELLESPDGTIWVFGGVEASAIRRERVTNYTAAQGVPPEGLRQAALGRDGTLYAAGTGAIVRFDGSRFRLLAAAPALAGNIAQDLAIDRDGTLWLAGTKGIAAVQPDGRSRTYGVRDGLPEDLVRAILPDRDGNLWIATVAGLGRLTGERFRATPVAGLSPLVWSLFEDRDGSLWVGTNTGLHQFRHQAFRVYGTAEGFPSDQPSAVYEAPDGALWIGFRDAGVMRLADGVSKRFTQRDGLAANEVFAIRGSGQGGVLVATRLGLTAIRGTRLTTTVPADALGRQTVYDVLDDAGGRRWLATARGVVRVEGRRQTAVIPGGPTLNSAIVTLAETPDGSIWAGTYGEGLWRYQDGSATRFTTRDGLSSDAVRALFADPSHRTLWIGTAGGGLTWFREGRFAALGPRGGLPSDNVGQIVADSHGFLWLGTTLGLARIDKRRLLDASAPVDFSQVLIASEGLRSSHLASTFPVASGGTRDRKGQLWLTTANGVAVLNSPDAWTAPVVAPAKITGVFVDGQEASGVDLEVTPATRQVEFRYAAVSLVAAERLRYRYRLEGLDDDWTEAGARRTAVYGRLPPGQYRFVVAASSAGSDTFGPSAALAFVRGAAWHEAGWFPYALVVAVLTLASLIYWERGRRARARFDLVLAERNRISRELHDTLSQHFVGIAAQLGAVAGTLEADPRTADRHLGVARKMARHGLTEARRSIMDLRSSALEGRDLAGAIVVAVGEMASQGAPAVVVVGVPGSLSEVVERELLRIVQEAIANAFKHAQAARVSVTFERTNGEIAVTIADDGVGIDMADMFAPERGHFGLVGMKERAERLKGTLAIQTTRGGGTTIRVVVPVA